MTKISNSQIAAQRDQYWNKLTLTGYVNAPYEVWEVIRETLDVVGLRVLDLATGTGGTATRLAEHGAQVVAIDLSRRALEVARRTAYQQRVDMALVCADVLYVPLLDAAFDLVISLGVMHYFRDPTPFLLELRRLVRPGGWILVETPQKYSFFTLYKRWCMAQRQWEYGDWETEYSVEALCSWLQRYDMTPVRCYAREYYPYPYYALRHLSRLEQRLGHRILPQAVWQAYDRLWRRLERGWWGLHTLRDVGVLAQKAERAQ